MPIINITSLNHPGVEIFHSLTEAQLRHQVETENGLFIAESPKVIRVALDAGYQPLALLCEERHITGDAADIIARHPQMPVYTGSRDLLTRITGYKLTRGVLCAMQRRPMPTVEAVCRDARRVVVIDNVPPWALMPCCSPPTRATLSTVALCACQWVRSSSCPGRG